MLRQQPTVGAQPVWKLVLPATLADARLIASLAVIVIAISSKGFAADSPVPDFNRDIRSILSENCFSCHGPDKHGRQAGLRLDDRDAAIQHGALVPGSAENSEIIARITSTDPDVVMPPPRANKVVTAEQADLLKAWVNSGARYQAHWAFIPVPKMVPVPAIDASASPDDSDSPVSSIDAFVRQALGPHGLSPAPPTTRERWLRRVSFDLTGLPPTVADLNAFLNDKTDTAFETVVDRLLGAPSFGERMASMWLDVARYADTFGYQSDVGMQVWPWRNWVIESFNGNLPYDQFIVWQTAGDLLPNATVQQKLATAFNRLHRQTNEGGSIEEEFRQSYIADRTVTNGTAFLGLTFECSRCHDHKYDPLLQSDFYRFASYFADIDEHGLYSHFTAAVPTPTLKLYEGDQEQQHLASLAEVQRLETVLEAERQLAEQRFQSATQAGDGSVDNQSLPPAPKADLHLPLEGAVPGVLGNATVFNGEDATNCDGASQYGRATPVTYSLWVKAAQHQPRVILLHQSVAAEDSAFRGTQLTLNNGRPQFSLIHFWPGNALRVEATAAIPVGEWTHLAVTYDGSSKAAGVKVFVNGQAVELVVDRDQLTCDNLHRAEWGDSSPKAVALALAARMRDVGFRDGLIDDLQVFHRQLSALEVLAVFRAAAAGGVATAQATENAVFQGNSLVVSAGAANAAPASIVPAPAQLQLEHYLLRDDAQYQTAAAALLAARATENELIAKVRQIMTMKTAVKPRTLNILTRGAYDSPADPVKSGTPAFLPQPTGDGPPDRLALANWLVSDTNPLVSRVTVNRFWHLFFGRGLVSTLEDFGSQGQPPTHPELLDWLARDFMNSGWNVKRLCRQIVLSATYRQSSVPSNPELMQTDPDNRWLARGPRHRLSAEQVRDLALSISGLLVNQQGGPSVMPYQPAGLWEEAGTGASYSQSTGAGLYRRSLYTFWKRTSPPPSMLTFDATSREVCTAKRDLTATPLQALILLNDPQYVEAARALAQQLIEAHAEKTSDRWDDAFRRMTSRMPGPSEQELLGKLYADQVAYFTNFPDAATQLLAVGESPRNTALSPIDHAATTIVVSALLGFDEVITKR